MKKRIIQIKAEELRKKLAIKDGINGVDGKPGVPGKNGPQGQKGPIGMPGIDGLDGKPGKDGQNGSPDTGDQIASKLNQLKEVLDYSVLKNIPEPTNRIPNGGGWRNLFQLHDVSVPSPTNGQALVYNSTTKLWEAGNAGLTKTQADTYYYPLSTNPAGYLTSLSGAVLATGATTGATSQTQIFTNTLQITALIASKLVFTDASKNLTSTGIGTSSQFIKGDGSLDSSTYLTTETDPVFTAWLATSPLSGLIPYTGATTDVNLGSKNFTTTGKITAGGFSLGTSPEEDILVGWDVVDGLVTPFYIGTGLSYDHATHTISATASDFAPVITDPQVNDTLIFDGVNWVNAPAGTDFSFSISTFTTNLSATYLIGTGVWKAIGAVTFSASYTNGPADSASINLAGTGGMTWTNPLTLSSPYTAGTSAEAINYPASKDTTALFTLTAYKNSVPKTSTSLVNFRNNIKYGSSSETTGWDSTDVNALGGTLLSNSYIGSFSVTLSAGEYVLFAHPASYATVQYFLYNSVSCPFESPETVSVTNSLGFTEDYKVYRSTEAGLGSHVLSTSTTSNITNYIYWGISEVTGSYSESDVEGLANSSASNTKGRTINVTASTGEYIIYALPLRLGDVTFTVNTFVGGFLDPEVVSITNANGYTEDYNVYRSTNSNLGATTITVT